MKLRRLFCLFAALAAARAAECGVRGGVLQPGSYRLDHDEGLIALLVHAEGFTQGGCTKVRVLREGGKKILDVNVWELMAEFQPDWLLQSGDVVVVLNHEVACLSNVKALNALMADYLKARAASSSPPANWKDHFAPKIGGDGQRDYNGAKKGVRDLPGKAGAR